jgi:crossover junction endodeoxyribonuclease RusA
MIDIFIPGHPAPQGSKRHVGGGVMVESSKEVKPWRESIRCALITEVGQPVQRLAGAVTCELEFVLRRPKSAPKRSTPPALKKPDIDKLCRAVLDAVTSSGVIEDDSRIINLHATKRFADQDCVPGLRLRLSSLG